MNEWINVPTEVGWYWMRVNGSAIFMVLVETRSALHASGQGLHYTKFKERDYYPCLEAEQGWQRIPDAVFLE